MKRFMLLLARNLQLPLLSSGQSCIVSLQSKLLHIIYTNDKNIDFTALCCQRLFLKKINIPLTFMSFPSQPTLNTSCFHSKRISPAEVG